MAQIPCRTCDFCKDKNKRTATFYCDGCEQALCLECKTDIHERVPNFLDHNLININKAGNRVFKLKPVCESHKNKFLLYCRTCDCLTCDECMTSSHNGHTTDTIKTIVDVYRKDAEKTQEKLKTKVEIVHKTLETIKSNQMHQIKSDYESYVQKVYKSSRELHGIVDNIKTINMTTAWDFEKTENQDLNMTRVFFQRQYDESSGTLLQVDNLLQESQDVTFFTDWKHLQTERLQHMCEIDRTLQSPRRIESFCEDNFMRTVIGEINKRLKPSIFKEKETEIELLTNAVKEKEILAFELEKENNELSKGLKQKQAEIEKLSQNEKLAEVPAATPTRNEKLAEVPAATPTRQYSHRGTSMPDCKYVVCVAIDIGTTYSGYAFSSIADYTKEPTKIHTNTWRGSNLMSFKAPNAVLLDSQQEFVAFGYDAENRYSELLADEEHEDYYYFHSFKMCLHDRRITRDMKIKDVCDKEMKALTVFKCVIKFLKDHSFRYISDTDKMKYINECDIRYILTVPVIWDCSAKQFMREAANMAGIESNRLGITLEPEAAAIYCQHIKTDRQGNTFARTIKVGMKYMVVDLGGGTADITVHQRHGDGSLEEVVPPSGVPCGGKSIDDAFHSFLKIIFGPKVMEEFRKTELEDFIDLFREFETKKRYIRVDQTNNVVITLPVSLTDLVKSEYRMIATALEQSPYSQALSYINQKLHIVPDTFRDLFRSTTEALIKHLETMFRDDKLLDLDLLIMVGGFSECELIQHRMKEEFGKHKKIIIPEEAGLAVLKGAVLYGHQPKAISARVLRRSYGIQSLWGPHTYNKSNIVDVNQCKDLFFKYVQAGDTVEPGYEVSQVFPVYKPGQKTLECTVYASTDPNPWYVTDPSCQRIGNIIISLPDFRAGEILEIEETLIFGDTELLVRARDLQSGRVVETQFDML